MFVIYMVVLGVVGLSWLFVCWWFCLVCLLVDCGGLLLWVDWFSAFGVFIITMLWAVGVWVLLFVVGLLLFMLGVGWVWW